MGPLTAALVGLLALFLAGDGVAHWTHYRYGETFSALLWYLQRRFPILHLVIGLLVLVLFTHLEFRVP